LNGWIKLDRNLLEKQIFKHEKLLKVWIWCLLKARHDQGEATVGLQKIQLSPGQFYTGRYNMAEELGMKPSTAWKLIKVLEKNQSLNIKSNNKFSVITLINWWLYQSAVENCDSKSNTKITTKEQQNNTNKKDKKDKKDKKYIIRDFTANEILQSRLFDYLDMRQKIKKPMTDRALELLLSKLTRLSTNVNEQIEIVETAIINGWQSVYAPNDKNRVKVKERPKDWNYGW
jgi:hypothetical protein